MTVYEARVGLPSVQLRHRAARTHHRIADVEESETQHGHRVAALRARRARNRERLAAFVDASRDIWRTSKTWSLNSAEAASTLPSFALTPKTSEKTAIEGWEDEGGSLRPTPPPGDGLIAKTWLKVKRVLRQLVGNAAP